MNDYWHIPRASLASSSASSAVSSASSTKESSKSYSNPPTLAQRAARGAQKQYNISCHQQGQQQAQRKQGRTPNSTNDMNRKVQSSPRRGEIANATTTSDDMANAKRGSRSSQGSTDSNNSTRSTASGSLLLTAANLERFAAIQRNQLKYQKKLHLDGLPTIHAAMHTNSSSPIYNANITTQQVGLAEGIDKVNSADTVIDVDPNLDFVKTKDLDTVSIASSMHFTMVNGEGGPAKKPKRGLCDRGRQVTVLIISMSTVFLLLIMGMVYALEMRARDMPQS